MVSKRIIVFTLLCLFFLLNGKTTGQSSGNAVYGSQNNPNYQKRSHNGRVQTGKTFLISSDVLFLAEADRYVAVLGVIQEGKTIKECSNEIEKRIVGFIQSMGGLGIKKDAISVDAITQNRIYRYDLNENESIAKEELKGFEIKKNIIISYEKNSTLDKIMLAAADENIYDLIKVDYVIDEPDKIYDQLYKEALNVIANKKELYLKLVEKKYFGAPEIIKFEKDRIPPLQGYRGYTAHESNDISIDGYARYNNLKKINARRTSTHYFEAAPKANFDRVINDHYLEPCVQFIIRLELRFEVL